MKYNKEAPDGNRKFKDGVFRLLCRYYGNEFIITLYNALTGLDLPLDTDVKIETIESVVFLGKHNDLAFSVRDILIMLVEHQSTFSPNMAYRMLQYVMLIFNGIISEEKLYSEQPIEIPTPKFIVLYNGKEKMPPIKITKLSDLFKDKTKTKLDEGVDFFLETTVKWIDINAEENKDLVEKCRILNEYATFVNKVNEFLEETNDLTKALMLASEYCISHSILEGFLKTHSREVTEMFAQEYRFDLHLEARFNDGIAKGINIGRDEGINIGRDEERQKAIRFLMELGQTPDTISKGLGIPESRVLEEIARARENVLV